MSSSIADNLAAVRARIARAAEGCGRRPDSVRLIAVSKTFGVDAIREAIAAGQRDFGENKVQEALPKIDALADGRADVALASDRPPPVEQGAQGGAPFDVIHSVDSVDLARRIDAAAARRIAGRSCWCRSISPAKRRSTARRRRQLRGFFDARGRLSRRHARRTDGDSALARGPRSRAALFPRACASCATTLAADGVDPAQLRELSMGMSHDFEAAIDEGATMVRVGHRDLRQAHAPCHPLQPLSPSEPFSLEPLDTSRIARWPTGVTASRHENVITPVADADLTACFEACVRRRVQRRAAAGAERSLLYASARRVPANSGSAGPEEPGGAPMKVTPLDLRQAQFRTKMRGFDPGRGDEVPG